MNKPALLERPAYQPMYRIQNASERFGVYSAFVRDTWFFRDAPDEINSGWESFDENSLPMHFTRSIAALHRNIAQLQDLLQPYSERDEKELMFMVESLVQTRRLIEGVQSPVRKGIAR